MMKRASRNVLILLLFVGLLACSKPAVGPEQQIRDWVAAGVDAAQRKELQKALKRQLVKRSSLLKIVSAWIITVPVSAVLAALFYFVLRGMMLP